MLMQAGRTSGFFQSSDQVPLYCEWLFPETHPPRACVIMTHGYDDHSRRYLEVARFLASRGFAVMLFDYRGHGLAAGQRGACDSFEEFLHDFDRALHVARGKTGDIPQILCAHSNGGLIALRALCDPQWASHGLSAVVLSSPYLAPNVKVSLATLALAQAMSRVAPRFSMETPLRVADLSHDPANLELRDIDPLCHRVVNARWYTEARLAQEFVLENVHRMTIPTLWLVAEDDRIVDAKVTLQAYERAGGEKSLHLYKGFFHEVFHEVERERALSDLENWLSPRFPAR
ncbi:MAG: lysophospholipase [Deltaproteobacteria bacterium]|nr:lysophospholipase [Deltaproteobacteria bacterium]